MKNDALKRFLKLYTKVDVTIDGYFKRQVTYENLDVDQVKTVNGLDQDFWLDIKPFGKQWVINLSDYEEDVYPDEEEGSIVVELMTIYCHWVDFTFKDENIKSGDLKEVEALRNEFERDE